MKRLGRGTLTSALFVAIIGAFLCWNAPAQADEIDDLRAENRELRTMVEQLIGEMNSLKGMVTENRAAVQSVQESPPAPAKMVERGKERVALSVSGQVNRMVLFADDGNQGRFFHADNDNSSTRLRVQGRANLDEEWSAGTNIVVQFESNASGDVTIDQNKSVISSNSFTERVLELYFASKRLGTLSAGQGPTASDGTSEQDLSGTNVIAKPEPDVLGRSIAFVQSGTPGTGSGTTVGNLFSNFDGLSRDDRLRYDSPTFEGLKLSTSWVDGDEWDVALRYGREFNGTEVALAGAYWDAGPTDKISGFSSSGSVLLPFGTSVTAVYAMSDNEAVGRDDADFLWFKLGQKFQLFDLGGTAASIEYGETSDQNANGTEGSEYGLALVQNVDKLSTELYGALRQFDADIPGTSTDAITIGGVGARVKF